MLKDRRGKEVQALSFLVLRPVLLTNAYFSSAIESYQKEHGSWSCVKEKLSIPPEAHDKAQSSEIFLSF